MHKAAEDEVIHSPRKSSLPLVSLSLRTGHMESATIIVLRLT